MTIWTAQLAIAFALTSSMAIATSHQSWPRQVARKTVVLDASRKVHGRILSGSTTTMSRGLINPTTPTMKPSGKRP
jgi:hypothetical protein